MQRLLATQAQFKALAHFKMRQNATMCWVPLAIGVIWNIGNTLQWGCFS